VIDVCIWRHAFDHQKTGGKGQMRQRLSGLAAGESADGQSSQQPRVAVLGAGSRLRGPGGKGTGGIRLRSTMKKN
jgi:hypothetical protein